MNKAVERIWIADENQYLDDVSIFKIAQKEYPFLKKDDIKAALLYAARTISLEETVQI
ncbi:MAG: hypothetical protein U0586_01855 [Candidatus Brocadiaceae bacterium]